MLLNECDQLLADLASQVPRERGRQCRRGGTRPPQILVFTNTLQHKASGPPRVEHIRDAWQEQLRRGGLELAVLLTVSAVPRYGLEIIRHLEESTDLVLAEGTVYPLLGRLSQEGLLEAEWDTRDVRPRKYYRLTARGRQRLATMRTMWRDFASKIDRLIAASED